MDGCIEGWTTIIIWKEVVEVVSGIVDALDEASITTLLVIIILALIRKIRIK